MKWCLRVLLIVAVITPAVIWAQPATTTRPADAPTAPRRQRATNPHWNTTDCARCHTMSGRTAEPIPPERIDQTCLQCHNGHAAPSEPHPIGRPAHGPGMSLPEGWPTVDGRIACITCHDLRLTAGHDPGPRRETNPHFLRGPQPRDRLAFCGECHTQAQQTERFNPHRMLTPEGASDDSRCNFCHTRRMSVHERRRTGDPALRADGITLCLGCHTDHTDYFEPGHISLVASAEAVARMVAAENRRPGERIDPKQIEAALQAGRQPTRLPLGRGSTIVCSTCHNPHQQGLFHSESVLSLGAIPAGGGDAVALRGGKQICGECHDK